MARNLEGQLAGRRPHLIDYGIFKKEKKNIYGIREKFIVWTFVCSYEW